MGSGTHQQTKRATKEKEKLIKKKEKKDKCLQASLCI